MKKSQEIFDHLKKSTIMVCKRNCGMIAPTSIELGLFSEMIGKIAIYRFSNGELHFSNVGIYLLENGKTTNLHKKIRKLVDDGFLVPQKLEEKNHYSQYRLVVADNANA